MTIKNDVILIARLLRIIGHMDNQADNQEEVFGALYEPDSLYNDTLQQILQGMFSGIILHHGKLEEVTREDILAGSNITPVTLDQYFKNPDQIVFEIHSEIHKITGQLEKNMERYRRDAVIRFLLENLRKQPLMLKILIALDDRHTWETSLRKIVRYVVYPFWYEADDETWDELYNMFCFQFQRVLKWWSETDFAVDDMSEAFQRIKAWIVAEDSYLSALDHEWSEGE